MRLGGFVKLVTCSEKKGSLWHKMFGPSSEPEDSCRVDPQQETNWVVFVSGLLCSASLCR